MKGGLQTVSDPKSMALDGEGALAGIALRMWVDCGPAERMG